jgi:VanZ family protein
MNDLALRFRRSKVSWRVLAWLLCLAVWTAALLTTFPAQVSQQMLPPVLQFPTAKCLHVCAYAFLTAFISCLPLNTGRRWALVAVLSLHAFATEFLQQFVKLRHSSLRDVGIDHLGIVLGLVLIWKWWRSPS